MFCFEECETLSQLIDLASRRGEVAGRFEPDNSFDLIEAAQRQMVPGGEFLTGLLARPVREFGGAPAHHRKGGFEGLAGFRDGSGLAHHIESARHLLLAGHIGQRIGAEPDDGNQRQRGDARPHR